MRIVDRKTFLAMPSGTMFSRWDSEWRERLEIKGETNTRSGNNCASLCVADAVAWLPNEFDSIAVHHRVAQTALTGARSEMDFKTDCQDELSSEQQLFAVWEVEDLTAFLLTVKGCLDVALKHQHAEYVK
jgi:hypothetical protein